MAIETEPGRLQHPGSGEPAGGAQTRRWWQRPAIHTGLIGAVAGYAFGHWLGNLIASGYHQVAHADANDTAIGLGYPFLVIGWLIGLGGVHDLVTHMRGKPMGDYPHSGATDSA